MSWLEKINGKEIWGTDGNIPKIQYGQITLTLGKNKIHLPTDNLFEPNFNFTTVHFDTKNNSIYIYSINGDGAGGYVFFYLRMTNLKTLNLALNLHKQKECY